MKSLESSELSDAHVLIDVRSPKEFQSKKISNSVNIPLGRLEEDGPSLKGQDNLVLVCATGNRASKAYQILQDMGVEACVLEGGLKAWEGGLEVSEPVGLSLERQVRIVAGTLAAAGGFMAILVHPYWAALSAFVGCGLVFAGVTDTCGMAMILAKLPYNNR